MPQCSCTSYSLESMLNRLKQTILGKVSQSITSRYVFAIYRLKLIFY